MIAKLVRPTNILELGTFTGYSALCMAEGLAQGESDFCKVITCDKDSISTKIAINHFCKSSYGNQVVIVVHFMIIYVQYRLH